MILLWLALQIPTPRIVVTVGVGALHHQCYHEDLTGQQWDGKIVKIGGPEFCGLSTLSDAEMRQRIADRDAQLPNRAREPQVMK